MSSKIMKTVVGYDLEFVRGYGSYLYDENGNGYLDFWGDEGISSLGNGLDDHMRKVLIEYFKNKKLVHVPKMYKESEREKLAFLLASCSKMDDAKVMFSNSGTEANEAMIKLARLYWYKKGEPYRYNIATLEGNFHGRTGLSSAASDASDSPYHKLGFGPAPTGFYTFSTIDELYRLSKMPGGLAGVMMATILGNNCIKIYPQEFFDQLEQFRKDTGTLLLFDEVQVSMGRTGTFFAYENFNIVPDIVTVGKGIAGGFPLSATIAKDSVAEAFTPGTHFNTFGGNAVSCRVANYVTGAALMELPKIKEKGDYTRKKLLEFDFISDVNGMGVHNSFSLSKGYYNKDSHDCFDFCRIACDNKLLIVTHRKFGEIRFTPPITVTYDEIDKALDILFITHNKIMNSL
jgi:acetylornithine/N-succinyldiaminopimelate aminotransferase